MLQFALERFVIAHGICFTALFLRLIKWRQQDVLSIKVEHSWVSRRGIIESWNIKMQWRGCVQCYPLVDIQSLERETAVAEIQQILKMPFPPPLQFPVSFFGKGPGLGIPDAESGKKKMGEKSYSTVQWR